MELMNALRRANHMETRWCLAACSCCSVYIAFLRQRAVPEVASAARARTSFRRSSVDGGGTGREKSPKNRGRHGGCSIAKVEQRHPRVPPGSTGHSVSCPCHQLGWVRMGGARPPAEEGQRRVVGHHRKVNRAAAETSVAVSTGLRPTQKRRALGVGVHARIV